MLIRRFRVTSKFLWSLLLLILTYTLYAEYQTRVKPTASVTVGNRQGKARYKLLIIVLTAPKNVEQRAAVRSTWLSEKYENVRHLFVAGTQAAEPEERENLTIENKKFGDLLVFPDLKDSYEFLTKKLLKSFTRIYDDYDFDFALKCDDDSLVVVDRVLNELEKWENANSGVELYWGFFNGKAQVKRSGPWKETDWIFCDFYLPYALGGGYVLSHRLVEFIAQNADILRIHKSEDVSVGLWLAPLINVERKHDVRFDTEYRSRGCSNDYIITHKQSVESMNTIYQTYKASGALCLKEVRLRNSYQYDWTVPPSKCCARLSGIP